MAQRALPPGAIRRRAVFGLLDADGWTWAGLKATFWFLFIIFMLGYVPNLAYYFTVQNTVQVGYNFLSIVNWCPADNEDLPCPAPAGATLPWQPSPPELALPAARAGAGIFQSGTNALPHRRQRATDGATAEVLAEPSDASTLDGNFAPGREGPALPEPRSRCRRRRLPGRALRHGRARRRRRAHRHGLQGHRRGRRADRLGAGRRRGRHRPADPAASRSAGAAVVPARAASC